MLPHWNNFAKALAQQEGEVVRLIAIRDFQLPPLVLETILPSMSNMTSIGLGHCNLGPAGFCCLSSFLCNNSSLASLTITREEIDIDMASALSKALSNHSTLGALMLHVCGLNESIVLEKILDGCRRIKWLGFRKNKIRGASAAAFADFIGRKDTQTKHVNLSDNHISDADVPCLVDSLQKNTVLKTLDIRQKSFTDKGKKEMTKTVLDTACVASIVWSNHTCLMCLFEQSDQESILRMNFGKEVLMAILNCRIIDSKHQLIRKKIVFALCNKPEIVSSLLHYLDESPLGLMPRILTLVQERQHYEFSEVDAVNEEGGCLSRLLIVLKGWRMTVLFEGVSSSPKTAKRKRKR